MAESFRSFNHSSSEDGSDDSRELAHKNVKKIGRSRSHSSNSGYSLSDDNNLKRSEQKRTRSGSIPLDNNNRTTPNNAGNAGNNSMSFGGDSDGSVHKNSDDDQLLSKGGDKKNSPKRDLGTMNSKRRTVKEKSNKVMPENHKMFDSVRNFNNASRDTSLMNHTGKFFQQTSNDANNRSNYTDPGSNTPLPPMPQTGKRTKNSSFMSSN